MHGEIFPLTHWRDSRRPSGVIRIASPGLTSRTLENPSGPNAESSEATQNSSRSEPSTAFRWPITSGLMPFWSLNANRPTWLIMVMTEYAPRTFFIVLVAASNATFSMSDPGLDVIDCAMSSAKTLSSTSESEVVFIMRPPRPMRSSSTLVRLPLWMR
jgi:hypothetical protein